ncbi:MAG: aminodeoxychorismate/anthranilate synthase component II [Pirellulales bacterium]|nr:aminodeoxychorismate/anthranilate synthase component II [Pirellulales bacterium]
MILLVDNFDSFVHNLARYLRRLGQVVQVVRNDAVDVAAVRELRPGALVLSPGPCAPAQAGACLDLVRALAAEVPILGVCLGHQVIAEALGGHVVRSPEPRHGRPSPIVHDGTGLFAGLPSPFSAGRYHSLLVDEATLPAVLRVTARTATGLPMALEHSQAPIFGVQFHPESILTEHGYELLANFLRSAGLAVRLPLPSLQDEISAPRPSDRALPTRPVTF